MQSESISKLVTALAKAQATITAPPRNREVTVRPKSGGMSYKFEYTTLDALIEHVREPLTQNGLWFVQTTERGAGPGIFILRTILVHESGEWIAGEMPVDDRSSNQELGSGLTYRKRYALAAILGLASDMDDDANTADGNDLEGVKDRAVTPHRPRTTGPLPPALKPTDTALKAAIEFVKQAGVDLKKMTVKEQLEAWLAINQAKVDRLKDYDKDLLDTVSADIIEARTRVT